MNDHCTTVHGLIPDLDFCPSGAQLSPSLALGILEQGNLGCGEVPIGGAYLTLATGADLYRQRELGGEVQEPILIKTAGEHGICPGECAVYAGPCQGLGAALVNANADAGCSDVDRCVPSTVPAWRACAASVQEQGFAPISWLRPVVDT